MNHAMQIVQVEWKTFDCYEEKQAIQQWLEEEAAAYLEWKGRETAVWLLSNYGRAPASSETTDEQIAKHLIECAVAHHLDIPPCNYRFEVKIVDGGAPHPVSSP